MKRNTMIYRRKMPKERMKPRIDGPPRTGYLISKYKKIARETTAPMLARIENIIAHPSPNLSPVPGTASTMTVSPVSGSR
uniref:Uncharacterized protein n=1 Tax=Arion vulgaris TaxID=1028688 RepID=A0A0B7AQY5_9EUPU